MRKICVQGLVIVFMLFFSITAMASDFEVEGGYLYTDIDIETDQLLIGSYVYESISEEPEKFDESCYFIGLYKNIGKYDVGLQYETFSQKEGSSVTPFPGVEINYFVDVEVYGLLLNLRKPLNDYISFNLGVGNYSSNLQENISDEEPLIYDVENGIGYKLGVSLHCPLSSYWNIIGNLSYRILELDYQPGKYVYEDGGEEGVSQEDKDNYSGSLDLDGYQANIGISYSF